MVLDHKEALSQILKYKNSNLESRSLFCSTERKRISEGYKVIERPILHIAILDLGYKRNILNMLEAFNCKVSILNSNCSIDLIKQLNLDAILVSNGPGNPQFYKNSI